MPHFKGLTSSVIIFYGNYECCLHCLSGWTYLCFYKRIRSDVNLTGSLREDLVLVCVDVEHGPEALE